MQRSPQRSVTQLRWQVLERPVCPLAAAGGDALQLKEGEGCLVGLPPASGIREVGAGHWNSQDRPIKVARKEPRDNAQGTPESSRTFPLPTVVTCPALLALSHRSPTSHWICLIHKTAAL